MAHLLVRSCSLAGMKNLPTPQVPSSHGSLNGPGSLISLCSECPSLITRQSLTISVNVQISIGFFRNERTLPLFLPSASFMSICYSHLFTRLHPTHFHHSPGVVRSGNLVLCPPCLVCSWLLDAFRRKGLSKLSISWSYRAPWHWLRAFRPI